MAIYSASDYLLDRANIHDTVCKMVLSVDTRDWEKLESEVISPQLVLDYTRMFGGEPRTVTPKELTESWKPLMEGMDTTQHLVATMLITLPQPGHEGTVTKASVLANVTAHLTKKGTDGGDHTSNGGRYEIEVEKLAQASTSDNPWRVSTLRAIPIWVDGNPKVLHG